MVISDEPVRVFVEYSPKIELGGYEFGPFKKQRLKLPGYLAVYLISKGLAELSDAPSN